MILVILKDLIKEYKRGRFLSFDTVGDFELNSYIEKLRKNSNLCVPPKVLAMISKDFTETWMQSSLSLSSIRY